jgi:hypothetical protein
MKNKASCFDEILKGLYYDGCGDYLIPDIKCIPYASNICVRVAGKGNTYDYICKIYCGMDSKTAMVKALRLARKINTCEVQATVIRMYRNGSNRNFTEYDADGKQIGPIRME